MMDEYDEGEMTSKQLQESEFDLLLSIYYTMMEDLRKKDVWKVDRPHEFKVKLTPGIQVIPPFPYKCSLSCHVTYTPNYPHTAPIIALEDIKGLTKVNVDELERQIDDFCHKTLGTQMMIEMFSTVIEVFLTKCEASPEVSESPGLYESMKRDEEALEERLAREKNEKKKSEQQKMSNLLQHRIEMDKKSRKKGRKTNNDNNELNSIIDVIDDYDEDEMYYSTPSHQQHDQHEITFTSHHGDEYIVQKTNIIDTHGDDGLLIYMGLMDWNNTNDLVIVHEWYNIKCPNKNKKTMTADERNKFDRCRNAVDLIQQEMKFLENLHHKHLVNYLAMEETSHEDCLNISILMQFVQGESLARKLQSKIETSFTNIQNYTKQMLQSLAYLHQKKRLHRNLKTSDVIVLADNTLVIGGYEIDERLRNLQAESLLGFPNKKLKLSTFEEGVRHDITSLGLIVLSLSQARIVDRIPVMRNMKNLSKQLADFLHCCFYDNHQNSEQLLNHHFITGEYTMTSDSWSSSFEPSREQSSTTTIDNQQQQHVQHDANRNVSRVQTEFEQLEMLGKGAYGDVRKVRNKLDGNEYALKRIKLQTTVNFFNRRITREVKLLSTLNHDNVVRYYNSWIETFNYTTASNVSPNASLMTSSSLNTTTATDPSIVKEEGKKRLCAADPFADNDFLMIPPERGGSTGGFSVSVKDVSRRRDEQHDDEEDELSGFHSKAEISDDDVSSSDDDDDDVIRFQSSPVGDDEDRIVFGENPDEGDDRGSREESETKMSEKTQERKQEAPKDEVQIRRYMYIQMEYCEKSTLRSCIDNELNKDSARMWRMFREILEGLQYIHKKEIIHRDLKPQNIFLDRDNRVKIGDFGLAAATRSHQVTSTSSTISNSTNSEDKKEKQGGGDDNTVSTLVGTTLYVAPELDLPNTNTNERKLYGSKADIYSLGIIFFEMFYGNMSTGMERVKVLLNLRKPQIMFPKDVDVDSNEVKITRWCLQHDPTKRPFAHELLQSNMVPALEIENSSVLKGMHEILQKPSTKTYRCLIEQGFNQKDDKNSSAVYDLEVREKEFSMDECMERKRVLDELGNILHLYGACLHVDTSLLLPRYDTSLLLPRYDTRGGSDEQLNNAVNLMDSGGVIVTLPPNLRVSFARYIKSKNVTNLRRFEFGKIYRARKVTRSRPRESWRCSFDIVTSQPTVLADTQIIAFIGDVIMKFGVLKTINYEVTINHMRLLRDCLLLCGCHDDHDADVIINCLSSMDHFTKREFEERLSGKVAISNRQLANLSELISRRGRTVGEIANSLKSMIVPASLPRHICTSLSYLDKLFANIKCFNFPLPIVFDLTYVARQHHQYDDVIFRVSSVTVKNKNKKFQRDVLAAGGRYDRLLTHFNHQVVDIDQQQRHHAVGISLSVDRIIAAMRGVGRKDEDKENSSSSSSSDVSIVGNFPHGESYIDVLVCAVGRSLMIRERLKLIKLLRDCNISCDIFYDESNTTPTLPEIIAKAQEESIACVAIVNHKRSDEIIVRCNSHNNYNISTKCFTTSIVSTINKCLSHHHHHHMCDSSVADSSSATTNTYRGVTSSSTSSNTNVMGGGMQQDTSSTVGVTSPNTSSHYHQILLDICIGELGGAKMSWSRRKQVENSVRSKLVQKSFFSHFSTKIKICVIVVDMDWENTSDLGIHLDVGDTESDFLHSMEEYCKTMTTSKQRDYVQRIAQQISQRKYQQNIEEMMLYSYNDGEYYWLC